MISFEELGIDQLFVDEAHEYKNLAVYTAMGDNIRGVSQAESQKATDLHMKCEYLRQIRGGKGTVFATGTPVSNAISELYNMQRYLQPEILERYGLENFDSWAGMFTEPEARLEVKPDSSGFRTVLRLGRYSNMAELMQMWCETADIKTADMIDLDVPVSEKHSVVLQRSEAQAKMVAWLGARADAIQRGSVKPSEDNTLVITTDGRKLALDTRLIDPKLPPDPERKSLACAKEVYRIWQETTDQRSTQLVFCDQSTPGGSSAFCVYDDIRDSLIEMGVPEAEIQYIHDAATTEAKEQLFRSVREGRVRVLLGSTQKMGTGTNVQDRCIALHHLDAPWRPSDIEQREGRMVRQGNLNATVHIYYYITEDTFDGYNWQTLENKQRFIGQSMRPDSGVRVCEDMDEFSLTCGEIKALTCGNPIIREKIELETELVRLRIVKSAFLSSKYAAEQKATVDIPALIARAKASLERFQADAKTAARYPRTVDGGFPGMVIAGKTYDKSAQAGAALLEQCRSGNLEQVITCGSYRGFEIAVKQSLTVGKGRQISLLEGELSVIQCDVLLCGQGEYTVEAGSDDRGLVTRIDNEIDRIPSRVTDMQKHIQSLQEQREALLIESEKPWPREAEMEQKTKRLKEIQAQLEAKEAEGKAKSDPETEQNPIKKFIKKLEGPSL